MSNQVNVIYTFNNEHETALDWRINNNTLNITDDLNNSPPETPKTL